MTRRGDGLIDGTPWRCSRSMTAARAVSWRCAGFLALVLFATTADCALKEAPIPDLKPPAGRIEQKKKPAASYWWIIGPAAGVIAGTAILLASLKKVPPAEPPAERARRELLALNGKGDSAGVARVFREYVESALGVRGRSATVEELLSALSGRAAWSDALGQRVRCFMDPVELAKFAPQVPAPPVERAVEEAMGLVAEIESMRGGKT